MRYIRKCFLYRGSVFTWEMRHPTDGFPALCVPVFAYNGMPVGHSMSISYTVAGKLYIVLIRCRHRNE